jgi:predicted transcriptional regulator
MSTLTIKLPSELHAEIEAQAARQHLSKSELVRQALQSFFRQQSSDSQAPNGLLAQLDGLVGCFAGGPVDLSTNPDRLADFGQV